MAWHIDSRLRHWLSVSIFPPWFWPDLKQWRSHLLTPNPLTATGMFFLLLFLFTDHSAYKRFHVQGLRLQLHQCVGWRALLQGCFTCIQTSRYTHNNRFSYLDRKTAQIVIFWVDKICFGVPCLFTLENNIFGYRLSVASTHCAVRWCRFLSGREKCFFYGLGPLKLEKALPNTVTVLTVFFFRFEV